MVDAWRLFTLRGQNVHGYFLHPLERMAAVMCSRGFVYAKETPKATEKRGTEDVPHGFLARMCMRAVDRQK